eukprot:scaffold70938_cov62-Phaeocystis_antarctica.AAC.3
MSRFKAACVSVVLVIRIQYCVPSAKWTLRPYSVNDSRATPAPFMISTSMPGGRSCVFIDLNLQLRSDLDTAHGLVGRDRG